MYAKGMSTRDISTHLEDIYGIEASAEMISRITDKVLPEAKAWQLRSLESKYIVMFLDAIQYYDEYGNKSILTSGQLNIECVKRLLQRSMKRR